MPTTHTRSLLRKGMGALTIGALALSMLVACTPKSGSTSSDSGENDGTGTLTIGMIGSTKDEQQPYSQQNSPSSQGIYKQLYNGLTSFDTDGSVVYELAELIEPNETLDVWTVHLKEGIALHNGEELTSEDVIESFQYMLDPENAYAPSTQIDFVDPDGMTALDDYTIEMKFNRPYGAVLDAFAEDRIVVRSLKGDATEEAPVGTGPFTLENFTPGQQVTMKRFDDYWGETADFDTLVFSFMQDQPAITNALRGGQIDIAFSVPFTDISTLEAEAGIEILASESASYLLIEMNTDIEPFDDPKVREAMRLLADREQIVSNAYGGYATVANDFIGNNTACPAPDVPQREQDIERAKELLAEAGAEDLSLELVTDAGFPGMMEVAQLYANQAAEAGVDIQVKKLDMATFLNRWREWPFLIGFTSSPYLVTATNHFLPDGEENATNFVDEEYIETTKKLYATADPEEQCEYVTQLQNIEYERGGDIVPVFSQTITAHRDNVKGLQPDLYGRTAFNLGGVSVN